MWRFAALEPIHTLGTYFPMVLNRPGSGTASTPLLFASYLSKRWKNRDIRNFSPCFPCRAVRNFCLEPMGSVNAHAGHLNDREVFRMTHGDGMNLSSCMVCMVILLLLAANPAAAAMNAGQGVTPERNSPDPPDTTVFKAIPPIDAAVPRRYQTASFGLG